MDSKAAILSMIEERAGVFFSSATDVDAGAGCAWAAEAIGFCGVVARDFDCCEGDLIDLVDGGSPGEAMGAGETVGPTLSWEGVRTSSRSLSLLIEEVRIFFVGVRALRDSGRSVGVGPFSDEAKESSEFVRTNSFCSAGAGSALAGSFSIDFWSAGFSGKNGATISGFLSAAAGTGTAVTAAGASAGAETGATG